MTNQEMMLVIGLSVGGLIGAKFYFDSQKRTQEESQTLPTPEQPAPAPAPAPEQPVTPGQPAPAPIMGAPLVGSFSVQAL